MTTAEQINRILDERYGGVRCAVLPAGTMTDIGAELGVSREYVRQIAALRGIVGSRGARRAPVTLCGSCGKPTKTKSGICLACRWADIPCAECGAIVHKKISEIVNSARGRVVNGRSFLGHGRVFCNRECMGRYAGKHYGWGRKAMRS